MEHKKISEQRFLVYIVAATIFLMAVHFYHTELSSYFNPDNYVGIHTVLEFISITVSFSIFLYGWWSFSYTQSARVLLLAFVFLIVGAFDLLHALSFKGMPVFIAESSIARATWFWLAARGVESVSMVAVLLFKNRKISFDPRRFLLLLSGVLIGTLSFVFFRFETQLPLLVIEGQGTTFLKNAAEYAVCFLHFASIILALYLYYEGKKEYHLYVALAFTFLFMSELIFTVYQSVFDIDNLTGHLYKLMGYFFIMKGFYFSIIRRDMFSEKQRLGTLAERERLINHHNGGLFKAIKKGDDYLHFYHGGFLLQQLGRNEEDINGRTLEEIFSAKTNRLLKNYDTAWEEREKVSFWVDYKGSRYIVSLVPIEDDGVVAELSGSAMQADPSFRSGWKDDFESRA
ncbi:MASE3 domain-containing protein [Mesobacillus zeae]|uniref:MASE3 domain-containing protein n=1 Tax=Mesobacillus zeae TaxID=1917180 RepID=UPI0015E744D1|nr:MASE3 domain-containing protein [Mesobacillus zeae]